MPHFPAPSRQPPPPLNGLSHPSPCLLYPSPPQPLYALFRPPQSVPCRLSDLSQENFLRSHHSMDPFQVVQLLPSLPAYAEDPVLSRASSLFAKSASFGGGGTGSGSSSPNQPGTPTSSRGTVECLDLFEKSLYLGTSDGYVLHYTLEERGEDEVVGQLKNKKVISIARKPVEGLAVIPKEDKMIAMSDSTIYFLSLQTLQPISVASVQPIRGVTAFAVDTSTDTAFRFCAAKRRGLQSVRVGEQIIFEKEVSLAEGAIALSRYNQVVCAADGQNYKLVRFADGETLPLFPYDRSISKPLICSVGKGEFLLTISSNPNQGLGVFVNSRGDAIRGTLQWSSMPKSVAFHFPYIVALLKTNTLEIHNLFTQELIQTLPIPSSMDPRFLSTAHYRGLSFKKSKDSHVRIVMRCRDTVVGLKMKNVDEQLRELLDAGLVERAVKMAEDMVNAETGGFNVEKLRSLCRTAGLMQLRDSLFDDAFAMFQKGRIDPLVLCSLFPTVATPLEVRDRMVAAVLGNSSEDDGLKAFEEVAAIAEGIEELVKAGLERNYPSSDAETMASFSSALVANAKEMLLKYLDHASSQREWKPYFKEIRTAQVKLLCEANNVEALKNVILKGSLQEEECEEFALKKERFYLLALLYRNSGKLQKALELWFGQLEAETHDPLFNNIEDIIDLLDSLTDKSIFLKYLGPTIKRDPDAIYKLFNRKSRILGDLDISEMTDILKPLGPEAETVYLEHLVKDRKKADPGIHGRLATLYLEKIVADDVEMSKIDEEYRYMDDRPSFLDYLEAVAATDSICTIRYGLLRLLMTAAGEILSEITSAVSPTFLASTGFKFERAVLLASKGEHEDVIKLLALGVKDFGAAEWYCFTREVPNPWTKRKVRTSTEEDETSTKLLNVLLGLYLDDRDGLVVDCFREAMRLLSEHPLAMDPIKVMRLIPAQCSLNTAHPFISSSLRILLSQTRQSQVTKSLVRTSHMQTHASMIKAQASFKPSRIDGDKPCLICRRVVMDPNVFVRLPGDVGDLVHLHCLRRPGDQ